MTTKPIIKWALEAPISLFIAVFARLLCPILPLFANEDGYLPKWLWWFQTPFDTLDGDDGSWERHPGTGKLATYWRRVCWLWRNAAYGFDMRVCGIKVNPDVDRFIYDGNPDIGDNSGISGKCKWFAYRGDSDELIAWQWYFVKHYELFWKWPKCVRIGFGWKLWNEKPFIAQFWLYCNPVK